MNNEPVSIEKDFDVSPSMDFAQLKRDGVSMTQQLAGDTWTDYNEHDPGVTILEQLCYAISEFGYRASFPIEDLFFSPSGSTELEDPKDILFDPSEILSSNPLTEKDYRKLIIDRVQGVKNAWILAKEQSALGIHVQGIYDVLLQVDEGHLPDRIIREVKALLNEHRNLGEDFDTFRILQPKKIAISADIIINPSIEGETVLSNILFQLYEALSPKIRFFNQEDLRKMGLDLPAVFDGPLPSHGFILDEDLEKSELTLVGRIFQSALIKRISEENGVMQINNFSLQVNDEPVTGETIFLGKGFYPVLDVEKILRGPGGIQIFIGEIPYTLDANATIQQFNLLVAKFKQQFKRVLSLKSPLPEPSILKESIEEYYSIQESFPRIYGISSYGIPGGTTARRRAQAHQLKAYLLLFEQHLLNLLAQLSNSRYLFSLEDKLKKTYFTQLPSSVPDVGRLFETEEGQALALWEKMVGEYDNYTSRRNIFLDHMLARFGESFLDDAYKAINRQVSPHEKDVFEQKIIEAKIQFLKNLVRISRNRGAGFNYEMGPDSGQDWSGFKEKICLLFNIPDAPGKRLCQLANDDRISIGKEGESKKGSTLQFAFSAESENLLPDLLFHGLNPDAYQIVAPAGEKKKFQVVFKMPGAKEGEAILEAGSFTEGEAAVQKLLDFLQEINRLSEGFHILEHVLLRPVDISYSFFLRTDKNLLLQSEFNFKDAFTDRKDFLQLVTTHGTNAKNYTVKKQDDGKFSIHLQEKESGLIAVVPDLLYEETATKAIPDLVKFVKELSEKPKGAGEELIYYQEQEKEGANLPSDPYSLRVSLVLPAWPAKFSSDKFRVLFEEVVKSQAPAHLSLRFFWVGMDEMMEFEEIYYAWKSLKSKQNPVQPLLDNFSYYLLLLLESFENPSEKTTQDQLKNLKKKLKL
ncbi:MAG: hypothetical protein IPH04_19565 [Saprospirales bacterium]|nr:hypothetical protein [Saprospirales bacterium]